MQLFSDALMVLGSRLGLIVAPAERRCYLPRYGAFPGQPLQIKAGLRIGGRERVLPLAPEGELFDFCEQGSTPTSVSLSGVDPDTRLKLTLTLRIPFRPRDADFSTMPALLVSLDVKRLARGWRWHVQSEGAEEQPVEAFFELGGEGLALSATPDGVELAFATQMLKNSVVLPNGTMVQPTDVRRDQRDRLVVLEGELRGQRVVAPLGQLASGEERRLLSLAWCAYDEAVFEVQGELAPFRYQRHVASLEEVCRWARAHAGDIEAAGGDFDALCGDHSLGPAAEHLLAYTFHSWLINTWWVDSPRYGEWYACWEGSCYFHSTVDVEYNQAPLYLAIWPELLGLLLRQWPHFLHPGDEILPGRPSAGAFLSHDVGLGVCGNGQAYPHHMAVEENANYVLLALAYWRRTGDDGPLLTGRDTLVQLLDFLLAADTTGNGIPDQGVANTIDDACAAVQYAPEQVYLGVKTHAALLAGCAILEHLGLETTRYAAQAERILATVNAEGWQDDHFLVCLSSSARGALNPWTHEPATAEEMAGWDAPHIYTTNGLLLLDMLGFEHPLSPERLRQDLQTARAATLTRYGCRHLAREDNAVWMAMNMWRDQAAAYRGLDMLEDLQRYWEWQLTSNSQEVKLFFETAFGNNLCFYPRGVACWGIFDAAAGLRHDVVAGTLQLRPLRRNMRLPLLSLAHTRGGRAPILEVRDGVALLDGVLMATG